MTHAEILGTHKPGEAMSLQDILDLLRKLPAQVRHNYPTVAGADIMGFAFAQSDQAEKWDFKVHVLTDVELSEAKDAKPAPCRFVIDVCDNQVTGVWASDPATTVTVRDYDVNPDAVADTRWLTAVAFIHVAPAAAQRIATEEAQPAPVTLETKLKELIAQCDDTYTKLLEACLTAKEPRRTDIMIDRAVVRGQGKAYNDILRTLDPTAEIIFE